MNVAEALSWATARLTTAGVDTPRLDAQLLLAWVLKCRREDLGRAPERVLSDRERVIFAKATSLRAERRPLPYITGEQWFYGRPFKINRAVLIPRPETELLVEAALEKSRGEINPRFADIGTGSGILAVTLACERPDAYVAATDLSADALTLARKNVVRHGGTDRVTLLLGDLLAPLPFDGGYDVIVSNPPYVTEADLTTLQPEVRNYEPTLALSGSPGATGPDGTALHRRLLNETGPYLNPGGWLMLEVGQGQGNAVMAYARTQGWADVSVRNDFAGIGRVVLARRLWTGHSPGSEGRENAKTNSTGPASAPRMRGMLGQGPAEPHARLPQRDANLSLHDQLVGAVPRAGLHAAGRQRRPGRGHQKHPLATRL